MELHYNNSKAAVVATTYTLSNHDTESCIVTGNSSGSCYLKQQLHRKAAIEQNADDCI